MIAIKERTNRAKEWQQERVEDCRTMAEGGAQTHEDMSLYESGDGMHIDDDSGYELDTALGEAACPSPDMSEGEGGRTWFMHECGLSRLHTSHRVACLLKH